MTAGMIMLIIAGLLVAFGVGQRALDRLRLTDAQAYAAIAAVIILGFVPDIRLWNVRFNAGGFAAPLIMDIYLFVKADTSKERVRSIAAALLTGGAIWAIMRFSPNEPESMWTDAKWLYGAAAAVAASLLGRSRRCAFIGGTVGVLLAQTASMIPVWLEGLPQTLTLGGAGAFDAVIIAGFGGVMLAELIGEIKERIVRGRKRPQRVFKDGEFVDEKDAR